MYVRYHFSFLLPDWNAWYELGHILRKFIPCILSFGVLEVNFIIDQQFTSYLAVGSQSLLHYTTSFLQAPLGIFAATLSTILLPHFSYIMKNKSRRINFYLLETAKLVAWVTIPIGILMAVFSYKVFYTLLLSPKFTLEHVTQASHLLTLFSVGLFFFAFNRIVLNIFYAMEVTWAPTVVAIIGSLVNIGLNWLLMSWLGLPGIVCATVASTCIQLICNIFVLYYWYGYTLHVPRFMQFLIRYSGQLALAGWILYGLYSLMITAIAQLPAWLASFLTWNIGYWLWVGPLCFLMALSIYMSRRFFGIRLYFVN
jgi:putative peptidoglycan lipid II flippase